MGPMFEVSPVDKGFNFTLPKLRMVPKPFGNENVEANNPGQLGFTTQMDFNNFHPLHELEYQPGQEISQGVATKDKRIHDRENVNELVDSFFEADRESRRKTPIHDEVEVEVERPNTLHKSTAGKGKKLQSVKGPGRGKALLLAMFKPNNNESWLLMGDFNEITCPEEKCGGKPFNYPKVRFFLDMIDECELFDLGFVGSIYTWTNKQNGSHRIWERIDRMMANEAWRSTFSGCRVLHELATTSDHKFLILKLLQDRVMIRRPFRFEIMWAQHDGCQEQIRDAFHKELQAPSLEESEKANLLKGVDTDEIVTALKHMKPFKSPGPDGYQAFFFQHFWNLVGDQ
ncbi:hypothetical protein IFM89_035176, partial [Coptis chinensis]